MAETTAGRSAEGVRVAVVGAGPAGFYAADMLAKQGAEVHLFERLPAPFGLLRYGVAPDHQNIKRAGVAFERTAQLPKVRFIGNVAVGVDLSVTELLADYDQVLIATGSARDRHLGIPGEDLGGSVPATSFVGWYNAHPDFSGAHFDLACERAVVIGMGNVAMDVVRILAKQPDELANTDIADYALEALRASKIREIVVLGRRGPAQAAFDSTELADVGALPGVELVLEGEVSLAEPPNLDPHQHAHTLRNLEYLATLPRSPSGKAERLVRLRFLSGPKALIGEDGRVVAIDVEKNELVERADGSVSAQGTGHVERIDSCLVIRSIGYQATALAGLPFDDARSLIPNNKGRVGLAGENVPRCYVVGWIKRGPVGLLGTNKQDARETVDAMLADIPAALAEHARRQTGSALTLLEHRGVRTLGYAEWQRIDASEKQRGAERGKIREKYASVAALLAALDSA
ncbi:MAG: FAD-dependent oxidoreductase [Myxococcota bacterium]